MPNQFSGITLTVNYPDDTVDAAIPSDGTLSDLITWLCKLCETEPEMTSFVLVAARSKANV